MPPLYRLRDFSTLRVRTPNYGLPTANVSRLFHSHSNAEKIFVPVRISVLTLWYILRYNFPMSNARPTDIFNLCQFKFANGRMCGLPAHPKHHGLCLAHARRASIEQREDDLSAELASPAGDFITQIDINHVLGNLFTALAANRISSRRATSLAYIGFLLLQSQEGAKDEARRWFLDFPTYETLLKLKYHKDHPNYPKSRVKAPPAEAPEQPTDQSPTQPPADNTSAA